MELAQLAHLNRQHQERLLELANQVLKMRLNYLELMSQHYRHYWLDADLKYYEARMGWLVAKEEYLSLESRAARVDTDLRQLAEQSHQLQHQSNLLKSRLALYHKLEPQLLAEYGRIKDDLECQDLIIEIGASNRSLNS